MNLLLVRHAEAEDATVSGADYTRKLTAHGHASAAGVAQGLQQCINGSVLLWSSPLLRTRETAAYIADAFSCPVDRYHEGIPAGDLDTLRQDWQALAKAPDTLILVGHQPHLGHWCAALTGVDLPVKKAACIAIELAAKDTPQGQLLWYALPEVLGAMRHAANHV